MNRITNVSTVSAVFATLLFAAVLFMQMPTSAFALGSGGGDGGCCGGSSSSSYTPPPPSGGGSYTPPPPPPPPAPTCSLYVTPTQVEQGGNVTITWSTSNASSVSLSGWGNVSSSGSQTDYNLYSSKTYTLVATGNGGSVTCSKTVTVKQPKPAPTCTLTANRTNITPGQDVTLTWTSQNAVSGTLSNYGAIALNSWINLFPSQNTTYTATFTSQDGRTVTCTTTVTVTTMQCPSGYSGTYPTCIPPQYNAPSCNIYVNNYNQNYNNQYGNYGQPVVINWNSQNAISGWINQNIGQVTLSGNRTVYPTQTTVYTATFIGQNNQTVTCSVTVNVNTYIPPVYQNPVPYVTLAAVPYTGLDLGPVGTTVYWGFLIAWCVFAAYLIAVKRVHMKIARWYNNALFGEETHVVHAAHVAPAARAQERAVPAIEVEGVDSFIISQIHRGNRA
ncbi:MAG TPA: hypothetical protein VHD31_01865 [Candidatus Paceibacterota bacterium]|nr:hypothetical protein [Candidatus Paceibacterota bacterium]